MMNAHDASEHEFAVDSDGVSLRCTAVGHGPTVVLLHAGGERRSVWRPVADELGARGFRAVAVDQRGHGETAGPVPVQLDPFARDVQAVIGVLAAPVAVVGASLGGLAALLALADPAVARRVSALVLVDVLPDPELTAFARVYLRGVEAKLGRELFWPLIEDILARGDDGQRMLAALRTPIGLVRGSHGNIAPPVVERFLQLAPSAMVRVVEGAGHLVARDRPYELALALVDILERCGDGAFHRGLA